MNIFNISKSLEADTQLVNFVELNDNVDKRTLDIVKVKKYCDIQDELEDNKTHSEMIAIFFSCMSALVALLAVFDLDNPFLYNGKLLYAVLANIFIMQRIRSNDKIEYIKEKKEEIYNKYK